MKGNVISYFCERFNCEVCRCPYPLRFQIPGNKYKRMYYLIDLAMPVEFNYMILESLDNIRNKFKLPKVRKFASTLLFNDFFDIIKFI